MGWCWCLQVSTGLSDGLCPICLIGCVSSLGRDEAGGTVVEQSQRTTPAIHHLLPVWCSTGSNAECGSRVAGCGKMGGCRGYALTCLCCHCSGGEQLFQGR